MDNRAKEEALNGAAKYIVENMHPLIREALKIATKCCPNCARFDIKAERCKMNNLHPPAAIIAFGCEMFEDLALPF